MGWEACVEDWGEAVEGWRGQSLERVLGSHCSVSRASKYRGRMLIVI